LQVLEDMVPEKSPDLVIVLVSVIAFLSSLL
jgi:hypothetical protein